MSRRLELEPFIECRGVKLLLAVLDVFAYSFGETFDNVKDTLLIVQLVGDVRLANRLSVLYLPQYILSSFQSISIVITVRVAVLAHGASRVRFDSTYRETGAGYIRFTNLTNLPRFQKVPSIFIKI